MKIDLNREASASAIAKILGIEFGKMKEFKQLLEESNRKTVDKSYVAKNKTVDYIAYNIIDAINYAYDTIIPENPTSIPIDV